MTLVLLQCTVLKMFSLCEKSCSLLEEMKPILGCIPNTDLTPSQGDLIGQNKREHITPVLASLHKISVFVYKS